MSAVFSTTQVRLPVTISASAAALQHQLASMCVLQTKHLPGLSMTACTATCGLPGLQQVMYAACHVCLQQQNYRWGLLAAGLQSSTVV